MGSGTKSTAAPPSSELGASESKYGGKKSGKARRYTFDDEEDLGSDQQEAHGSTGVSSEQ